MKDVILHGLTLDLSTALYVLTIPLVICIISIWSDKAPLLKQILRVYFAIVAFAFALAFVADTSLYPFWGFKLDASCLQYLNTPGEAAASVSTGYIIVRIMTLMILTVIIAWGYWKAVRECKVNRESRMSSISESVFYVFCLPLMVIGIRGGINESTTNIGQVYFSQNQFLNHAAVNPVFSFIYSLSHMMGDTVQYCFMEDEEAWRLTDNVYTTRRQDDRTTGIHGGDSLLTTTRPDIVVILLESAGEQFAEAMPYLQKLKGEGISFSQCYGNSWRTDRGTVCTYSGYPSFPSLSVMKMPQKSRTLPSIARTLQAEGYMTTYLYGGDINFTNMRSYLVSTGWEKLISMDDFTADERVSAEWGVRDDITFATLTRLLQSPARQPRLIGFSTLSSHEPWDVPTKTLDDEVFNAFAYVDRCLKDFVETMKKSGGWDNLLIVILADHGIIYRDTDLSRPLEKNHIPMVWAGGAVRHPQEIGKLCNQSDLAATLLSQLGLMHDDFSFSRDVTSEAYRYPTAVHNYNNVQLLIDSTGYILYDFDARRPVISQSPDTARLIRLNQAILQVTTNDLKKR